MTAAKDDMRVSLARCHARFTGTQGTLALFGDSMTESLAFWAPLAREPRHMTAAAAHAYAVVRRFMNPACWAAWRGPEYGNQSMMTIRWAHANVHEWLRRLNPEVAVLMFGSNDLDYVPFPEYLERTDEVTGHCLQNGTIVILTTLPPRSARLDECRQYAEAIRGIARANGLPLVDYFQEMLVRRPDDWDGSLPKFRNWFRGNYDVPTLISRDGMHPSNPKKYRDFSEASLRCNGYALRNYLTLMAYAELIKGLLASSLASSQRDVVDARDPHQAA